MSETHSGEYIKLEKLGDYALDVSKSIRMSGYEKGLRSAEEVLHELSKIKKDITRISKRENTENDTPKAAEWLLDNWYIAEREGKEAALELRKIKRIRKSGSESIIGQLASSLVRAGNGSVDDKRIGKFLDACQENIVLNEYELAAFVPMLKAKLIGLLGEASGDITADGAEELFENIFTSLRFLSGFDMGKTLENVNRVERELYLDPAGVYPRMDETTRREYRNEIAKLARKKRCTEYKAATYIRKAAELDGRHIGYYIFKKPFGHEKKEKDGSIYIASIVLASLFFTILTGYVLEAPIACALLLFPISEIVKNIVDFTIIKTVRPKHIPRMGMKKGVPAEGRTVCVISALLNSKETVPIYAAQLEEYYLANRSAGGNLIFGVLCDLPESRTEQNKDDDEIIEKMRAEIDGLNEKYGGKFYFFCRPRKYNESCARYMGWERKRGAILELVRLIKGRDSGIDVICGEKRDLCSVKYIITLDSDTTLEPDTAMELIGAMLHPLNRAVVDKRRKIVKEGSGIIQPRVSVSLEAANKSDFTRIFAGRGGTDPYGGTVSDVYQDIFGRGSFNGKGIIDVEAYYECLDDRFPENAILSHDLLEGAYLHCSYMGECERTDGYPYKVTSYYDRMHRWVRGDWQTIPWLGRKVKNANGETIENPISEIDKWKIADNLRRSLTPVFTFAAIVTGMFTSGQDFAWACFIAILSAVSALLISSADLALRHDDELKLRYQSTVVSGFAGCFLQTVIRLIFLPYEAWTAFSAIVTALYRMTVSHKNMLSWVTAAETEKKTKGKWSAAYAKMWQCIAISAVIWIFSPYPAAYAVGIIWFFAPLYAAIISGETKQPIKLTPSERNYVLNAAADIWRYFTDFVTPSENYLPPDNWQEQPAAGVAHRTSPTNIGLAMMSALAAFDMGIANRQTALGIIENMLATVKRLPKWNGHLYNWYDTRTLNILRPNYVSTVDSGNFAASLIVVREAMYELGADKLAEDITRLLDGMDFGVLYDKTRRLFYIGWDDEKNAPTEGWYDLMESEARQTSYVAIARGDVPRKHWRQLSRVLVAQDDYSGMASWTGTMFEYLMPNLILPCYKNSMIYESSKFCVYAQKRAARDIPWGMSESAFYAFDQSLSYRYKAHGAQKLALKRGMDADRVISPYSSFLAMTVEPKQAIKNLRRMDEMGLCSRYGFYEAADFTPDRTEGKRFRPVKTFMAHHLGMSIIAADNVVNDNIMQARFMRNREMSAYKSLLQEKVVASGIMIKRVVDIPEKPGRNEIAGWSYVSDKPNAFAPMCCLLSNGSYTVMVTESGLTRSKWRDTDMLSFDTSQISPHSGMLYTFRTEKDEFPLTFAPYFDRESSYSAEFSGAIARLTSRRGALTSSLEIKVPRDDMGEKREVELLLGAGGDIRGKLVCDFEAVLAKLRDFDAHPAYSRLSLEIKAYENALVIKRRSSSGEIEKYMCIAVSAPSEFYCGGERGRVRPLMPGKKYCAPEPPVTIETPVCVGRSAVKIKYAVAAAYSEKDAIDSAVRILIGEDEKNSYIDKTASRMKLTAGDIQRALKKVSALTFITDARKAAAEDIRTHCGGQRGLWKFGISGDVPIVTAEIDGENGIKTAKALVSEHLLLKSCGLEYDLVLFSGDMGDYRAPVKSAVSEQLHRLGCENALGGRGGVHIIDAAAEDGRCVRAMASLHVGAESAAPRLAPPLPVQPIKRDIESGVTWQIDERGYFVFDTQGTLPEYVWSLPLANSDYGYIATDTGSGHMWHLNSRENKINRWTNRPASPDATEELSFERGGRRYSLFAANDGINCHVTFGFGFASWQKDIDGVKTKVTSFVLPDEPARIMLVELENAGTDDKIRYFTELVMGDSVSKRASVVTEEKNGVISAENPGNTEFADTVFRVAASQMPEGFTCDRLSWAAGELDAAAGGGHTPCIAAVYRAEPRFVLAAGCLSEEKMRELTIYETACKEFERTKSYWDDITGRVRIKTPSKVLDDYINGWALYQNIACRMLSRTSAYQCGGAYGFRDQLQDVCALTDIFPELTKKQILMSAAHQFTEGDVQHWWHKSEDGQSADKGVRTRCTDDLIWHVYAVCEYTNRSGDYSICGIEVPYISSEPLKNGEHERYEHPRVSELSENVFMHCIRAVELVIARGTGEHGLCYIGTGDWNDGMNMVGVEGHGESLWLQWFFSIVLKRFASLCETLGYKERAQRYRETATELVRAAEKSWDGGWYRRGYYDDGKPLGSAENDECRIDSIAQSFSVFADADSSRRRTALENTDKYLFDREHKVIKLFTPPFSGGDTTPGYIKGYCPGYRENGGQYTHAAIWLAMAFIENGDADRGWEMLYSILPQSHDISEYKKEPFVIPADVCSDPERVGMGGWTWYTGSAGWYYRAAVETLLGIKLKDGNLTVNPNLPSHWDGYEAEIKLSDTVYKIKVKKELTGEYTVEIDGKK